MSAKALTPTGLANVSIDAVLEALRPALERARPALDAAKPALDYIQPVVTTAKPYITNPLYLLLGLVLGAFAYAYYVLFISSYFSSFKNIPGPPKTHWLLGNMERVVNSSPSLLQYQMGQLYGRNYKTHAVGGKHHLVTSDLKLINYMITHPDLFMKPRGAARLLTDALGLGLVTVEGAHHRRQRRVLNPAFGWVQMGAVAPVIFQKGFELRHRLLAMVENGPEIDKTDPDYAPGARKIDILRPLSAATLDIIGLVGFGYDLRALEEEPNPLREAYNGAIAAAFSLNALALVQIEVPAAGIIPSERRRVLSACRTGSQKIGAELVAEKKRVIADMYDGKIEKSTDVGKDVLSLLIKANMAPDLRDDQKMTDDDLMHQISTVLFAGHETTGTALMWCLRLLAIHPEVQDRLRAELQTVDTDEPTFEELHALPYLDKVIHETLRLESPIPISIREAMKDTVLPLDKPIRGIDGKLIESIPVKKGDRIHIPIAYINTCPDIWGEDSILFRPDRWDNPPSTHIPGVWGNIMTFLGGPRNCIGHRLTICEMKIVIFILFRRFAFEIPPSKPVLKRTWLVIQRAVVEGEEGYGPQMPLMVRPL